jgi:hypothetical protein
MVFYIMHTIGICVCFVFLYTRTVDSINIYQSHVELLFYRYSYSVLDLAKIKKGDSV